MTDFVEPYSVVMRPKWNDTVASVLPAWQSAGVTDPEHRVWIPAGVMMVRVTSESRFLGEVVFRRTGTSTDRIVGTLPLLGELFFTIGSEGGAEMWINLSGIPNTNDQANTRITVTVIPMSGGGVGFSGLLFSWWAGGHDDRSTGLPTATDNYSETQCDYRSLLSGDRRAKQIRKHNFRRSWGSLRSHRRTDAERKHQHSTSFSPCRGRAFSNRVHHDSGHRGTHGENRGGYTGCVDSDSRHRQHERFGYSQGGRDCHAGRLNLAAVKVVAS